MNHLLGFNNDRLYSICQYADMLITLKKEIMVKLMKIVPLILIMLAASHTVFAQKSPVNVYAAIDKKALQIPDSLTNTTELIANYITANFSTDKDKARAIFAWVASSIEYDLDNMFALNYYEKKEDKINKALKTRKGICENYAFVFTDICMKAGLKSYVISGYTKQNGFTDYLPHAWCATLIDTSWFLFDPTWGSGYVSDGKFYKKINNDYFKGQPAQFIKSHMPFDYLWQFLYYPITHREFLDGKTAANQDKAYFNFTDTLQAFELLKPLDQLLSTAYRIEKNGVSNSLVFDRLQRITFEIESEKQNSIINLYNAAVVDYNEAIYALNDFINYRNHQFTPIKPDPEIQKMLDSPALLLKQATHKLGEISTTDENTVQLISQLVRSIDDASKQITEQQDWLKLYFSKGKLARRSMFYKVTWYGIPLN